MRVILEPRVEIVARSEFVGHENYQIPDDGGNATRIGAFTAKGCYDSYGLDGRANEVNQRAIIESRHGSVLEHISVSLFIEGITRACSLELNRHRHFSISQRSTRYTNENDAAIVLDPYYAELYERTLDQDAGRELEFINGHLLAAQSAFDRYRAEVRELESMNPLGLAGVELRKWARGKARNILPHALETRGTWTGNLRAWRHFIELRSQRYAETEIRRLAAHVFDALEAFAPLYFEDYASEVVDGFPEYHTPYGKI